VIPALFLTFTIASVPGRGASAAEPPAAPRAGAILELTTGGFVAGEIRDSDRADALRWLSPAFVEPFEFDLDLVDGVQYLSPADPPRPPGDKCFELAGGDMVFGTLVELDDQEVVIDASKLGRLHVRRSRIRRIEQIRDRAEVLYAGPNGLTEWRASPSKDAWRAGSGRLATEKAKQTLRGDFGLPAQAMVEFEISWLRKPDFTLTLGVDAGANDDAAAKPGGFRFEVWGDDLTALRETDDKLSLASVAKVSPGPGRVCLRACLDQEAGRLLVSAPDGEVLADLRLAPAAPRRLGGIALTNVRGDVRLENLRIMRWDGRTPAAGPRDQPSIQRTDGTPISGQIVRFDPLAREFLVRDQQQERRIAEGEVACIALAAQDENPASGIRAVSQDGTRVSGALFNVENGALCLSVLGVKEFLRLPVAGLRSLVMIRNDQPPRVRAETVPVLELAGLRLPGRLLDGRAEAEASCIVWQPQGSATASHLRAGVSGKIVLREPPPSPPAPIDPTDRETRLMLAKQMRARGAQMKAVQVIVQQPNGGLMVQMQPLPAQAAAPSPPAKPSLHLRSGDVIPAEVTKIDGEGVWFRSPLSRSTFVAHSKVKAVELAPESADAFKVGKSKRERLLTVPRMQKEAPPTHMVRSKDGDYLRGRVVALSDTTLQVEVRLETKDVPRDRIARIIWLHGDELQASKDKAPPVPAEPQRTAAPRVQVVQSNGDRLTFVAEQVADATVLGPSEILGACRAAVSDVDQILIGDAIEQAAAQLAYHQWTLHNAPDPRAFQDENPAGPDGRAPGTIAALVGKPAPEFELGLLGGAQFRLADAKAKGQVVLLDFWATWCGPCMQAMPQVERVAEEFRDRNVQLVAVNLQESPERISAMLKRLDLHPTVALDRDGEVANRYGATAIPQTVIIDRDGTVARLFVGGGPHLGDQLRDALNAVLSSVKEP
jgi:thiol-disulfide isomerase/thioredoxin